MDQYKDEDIIAEIASSRRIFDYLYRPELSVRLNNLEGDNALVRKGKFA
jgi:hypothetical protein